MIHLSVIIDVLKMKAEGCMKKYFEPDLPDLIV